MLKTPSPSGEYLADCAEHLAAIEVDLLAIEEAGAGVDEEVVGRVIRAVHSVKGGADVFDLVKIRDLAHKTEDVLALIRSREVAPAPDSIRVLLRAVDQLKDLIRNPDAGNTADIADVMAPLEKLSSSREPPPRDRRLRILIAEDDFFSRLVLQKFLSPYGECHIALNGHEVVTACRSALSRRQNYDLICMDLMMPEMDGKEAVRKVRALEEGAGILSTSGARIFMTTAVRDVKQVIRCFQELCDVYLTKPIDMNQLLAQMKAYQLIP